MAPNVLIIAVLATVMAGGIFYVFAYPYMSGEKKAEKRQKAIQTSPALARANMRMKQDVASRRKQISDSLKQVEARGRPKVSLKNSIAQAGLTWTMTNFWMISAACAVAVGLLTLVASESPLYAIGGAVVGAWGLPRWIIGFLKKRRINKFVLEFPNAVDVITRGIKAGLPLNDTLRIIAAESAEPVRGEFRAIIEQQAAGLTVSEAVERIAERVPIAEANFFSIVINIQQKAGGNLSEALSNLSRVLRERKKMKQKIKAVSSEAKSSAMIIGCLPFAVSLLVYITAPQYISLLWTTSTGRYVLLGCAVWMGLGMFIMRKMINFEI